MVADSPRLLVLACSGRKRQDAKSLPAIQRYDGPTFRVLRKYLGATPHPSLHTYVLSAEYGLIAGNIPIPLYDRRMTRTRAKELRPRVAASFACMSEQQTYGDVLLCMGSDYLDALDGAEIGVPAGTQISRTSGSIGRHLSDLHAWLWKGSPESAKPKSSKRRRVVIHGIELTLNAHEVLEIARESMAHAGTAASRYQSWYLQVDHERVAPKWLVSQLTGLPVSAFRTADATRVLGELGVEVSRS